MAKRSALVADSFSADVRPGLVASLRISERCCSSSSLVRHSMSVSPVFHFNEYFDSPRFEIARRCVALLQVVVPWRVRQMPMGSTRWTPFGLPETNGVGPPGDETTTAVYRQQLGRRILDSLFEEAPLKIAEVKRNVSSDERRDGARQC